MSEENPREKRPLLTARQVGIIAALGGLGFTWRALGLVVPLFPPYVLGIRYTILVIASFAGGPYVAIATGFMMGLPSAVPPYDCVAFPGIGLTISLVAKRAWRWIEEKKYLRGHLLVLVAIVAAEYLISAPWGAFVLDLFGIAPFWPFLIGTIAVPAPFMSTSVVHILQEFIPLTVVMRASPDFMKPRWLWSGGEEVE